MNDDQIEQIIQRVRAGDTQALAEFIQLRRDRLLGLLRIITGEHLQKVVEIEDLLQEVAATAVEALPRVPKADLDFDRWLEQLARRRVVDAHRRHFGAAKRAVGRQQVFSQFANADGEDDGKLERLLIASMTSPSMAVSRNFKLDRLRQALDQLSTEQQQMLELRFGQGLTTGEIAERTGKTDVAIRVALSRTIKRLEELLGAE